MSTDSNRSLGYASRRPRVDDSLARSGLHRLASHNIMLSRASQRRVDWGDFTYNSISGLVAKRFWGFAEVLVWGVRAHPSGVSRRPGLMHPRIRRGGVLVFVESQLEPSRVSPQTSQRTDRTGRTLYIITWRRGRDWLSSCLWGLEAAGFLPWTASPIGVLKWPLRSCSAGVQVSCGYRHAIAMHHVLVSSPAMVGKFGTQRPIPKSDKQGIAK